jgi:photosystem II stability/assembly factor-like uncharacterized protein
MASSGRVSLLAVAVAGLLFGLAGCGSSRASGPVASSGTRTSNPARSASSSSESTRTPAAPVGVMPSGGPVPARFAATSVTFVSADEAFVLGTAPCAHAPCTAVVRTLDRGQSWVGLPAPAEPVGQPGLAAAPAVWGIRFATPGHGFVFGDGLWETTDGGGQWIRDAEPGGSILSLAIAGGQVLALTARCTPGGGCGPPGVLERRSLGGGSWTAVEKVTIGNVIDPDDLIATQAGVAAVASGGDVLVTGDGGLTFTDNPVPCPPPAQRPSVAVTSPHGLALLCVGEGYTGHTIKQVYVSRDDGAHWARAGAPSPDGDAGTIAATAAGEVAIATASAASWLLHSGDAGSSWRIVHTADDGGAGWADLGFTTATDGVVVHGPANSDGNSTQRPGQLFLTSDGGTTWYQVSF